MAWSDGSCYEFSVFSGNTFPQSSDLQLESFAHRLSNDEYAEGIPRRCFILPTAFHIDVADLTLETPSDVKAASNMLRRLDMQRMLKDAATSSTTAKTKDPGGAEGNKTRTRISVEPLVPPLHISLTGLKSSFSRKTNLYARMIDSSDRLRSLVRSIRREFASAGFRVYSGPRDNEGQYLESKVLGCLLVTRRGVMTTQIFTSYTGTIVKKRKMTVYDATPLFQRYKNVEIARNIAIDKLSLCKEGRKRTFGGDKNEVVVDEYYEEIDSIPMPQEA